MAEPFFRVERLTKRFGGLTAVNGVGFELRRDEIVGLIGPNGAGKTTLLRLITKILRPDQGRIVFAGEDITALRPWEIVERGIADVGGLPPWFAQFLRDGRLIIFGVLIALGTVFFPHGLITPGLLGRLGLGRRTGKV